MKQPSATHKIIAMWSGPRNLSTAMMRSFGSRSDCYPMDEPFYAAYLKATGFGHPMANEIIEAGETNSEKVIAQCLAPPPDDSKIVYQKHMTHHMIEGFDLSWLEKVSNCFLIREPKKVLASYAVKSENVTADDTGFKMQRILFDKAKAESKTLPLVIAADTIRKNPKLALRALCEGLEIEYDNAMLSWEPGPKPEDGIWASHWYDAVWKSSGFAPAEITEPAPLPDRLIEIEREVLDDYQYMLNYALTV